MTRKPCTQCGGHEKSPQYIINRCDHCNGLGFEPTGLAPFPASPVGAVEQGTLICSSCAESMTVSSYTPAGRPFSRITRTLCGCGCTVERQSFLDVSKLCSAFPLPGYDRQSMLNQFDGVSTWQ